MAEQCKINVTHPFVYQMLELQLGTRKDCIKACTATNYNNINDAIDWLLKMFTK